MVGRTEETPGLVICVAQGMAKEAHGREAIQNR